MSILNPYHYKNKHRNIYKRENEVLKILYLDLVFELENLASYVVDNKVKLPSNIIIVINSNTISTLRGSMFSTFKRTYFHNTFSPLIDLKLFQIEK